MSTRKSCPLPLRQEDQEEKRSEGTPDLERQECEVELRNKAILQQKRRLKQATQFVHKDSADLLPLDGLTRLGTSKDLQPHSVVQRRLLEGNLNKLRRETRVQSAWVQSPLAKDQDEKMEKGEDRRKETSSLLIQCQTSTIYETYCYFSTSGLPLRTSVQRGQKTDGNHISCSLSSAKG